MNEYAFAEPTTTKQRLPSPAGVSTVPVMDDMEDPVACF